ncbi:hypothetical protein [Actinomadura miaoliensis]|uniref:XRE family transcriptional regulator n=1 Tax=Actinomadura miaoliensis TaxID=430685 RepID=A0ABP7W7C9_9ACTN
MSADKQVLRKAIGARLRAIREDDPYWTRGEMAQLLRGVATTAELPHIARLASLTDMIKQWEAGAHLPRRRYRLLYCRLSGRAEEELFGPPTGQERMADPSPEIVAAICTALFSPSRAGAGEPPAADVLKARARRAWQLRQSTDYNALGELLVGALADSETALHAHSSGPHSDVLAAYVHIHNAAASLLKRLGASEAAAVAADRALQAARATDDLLLVGAATLRLANVFLAGGRLTEAVDTAVNGADALLPRMHDGARYAATWGALLLTGAVAAASLRDRSQAWEMLGQAKVAGALLDEEFADLHAIFGPVNLAIHGVQVATELDDHREALLRARRVNADRLPPVLLERRSTLLIDVARAHRARGDNTAAAGALQEAERVAPQEVRYNPVARTLASGLLAASQRRDPDLRALAERLGAST